MLWKLYFEQQSFQGAGRNPSIETSDQKLLEIRWVRFGRERLGGVEEDLLCSALFWRLEWILIQ